MNKARKAVKKDEGGLCGIIAATKKAAKAIIHQGKNKPPAKLNNIVRINATTNFIYKNSFL
jgi:hypothetical protein